MAQIVEDWYRQMPIITRSYLTLSVLTTAGCALEVISPYSVYLNPDRVVDHWEVWRLVTNFFYFGKLGRLYLHILGLLVSSFMRSSAEGLDMLSLSNTPARRYRFVLIVFLWWVCAKDLDFLFHMFFLARYCKLLEETSFRGRTADFFFMLLFGATLLTLMSLGGALLTFFLPITEIYFLSNSLTFMMVYVWSKRNPNVQMSFLGLFSFTAPYLPWVLLGFSIMVASSPWVDLLGMAAGHAYYFLEDVYPVMTGRRILKTPGIIKALFPEEVVVVPPRPANGWNAPGVVAEPQLPHRD